MKSLAMSETAVVLTSTPTGLPDPEVAADQGSPDKKKKKKAKVRSAWISFIGRILAQMCGAVATVVLGLQLVRGYFPELPPADAARVATDPVAPAASLRRPAGMKVLAVLPVANYSSDRQHDAFSDGLTEALIAELAEIPGVHITSRTSSMHFREKAGLLPSIARQLGVDLVLESSVVTSGGRRRITVQMIDAATDLHVWVRRYDSEERDVLALLSTITAAVVRDLRAAGIGHEEE
jgi:TolB-like protein